PRGPTLVRAAEGTPRGVKGQGGGGGPPGGAKIPNPPVRLPFRRQPLRQWQGGGRRALEARRKPLKALTGSALAGSLPHRSSALVPAPIGAKNRYDSSSSSHENPGAREAGDRQGRENSRQARLLRRRTRQCQNVDESVRRNRG